MIVKRLALTSFLAALSIVSRPSFADELAQTEGVVLSSTRNTQAKWRWCHKCDGLHYIGGGLGPCPAGGRHSTSGSGAYALPLYDTDKYAGNGTVFYWCRKCQGLFTELSASQERGVCPAGGGHDNSASSVYVALWMSSAEVGQESWRLCTRCAGLFYAGRAPHGRCPAGREHTGSAERSFELLKQSKLPILWGFVYSGSGVVSHAVVEVRTESGSSRVTKTYADGSWCTPDVTAGRLFVRATKGNLSTPLTWEIMECFPKPTWF